MYFIFREKKKERKKEFWISCPLLHSVIKIYSLMLAVILFFGYDESMNGWNFLNSSMRN